MLKRKASDKPAFSAGKKKCSLKFEPEWLRVTVKTKLPALSRKQATKLVNIFSYRERKDDVIRQKSQEVCAVSEFANGKRWDQWNIDYLKHHISYKVHLDSVFKLSNQKSGYLRRH